MLMSMSKLHDPSFVILYRHITFVFVNNTTMIMKKNLLTAGLLCLSLCLMVDRVALAQSVTLPRVSPLAEVKQTVGLTEIAILYSRPNVISPQGVDRTGSIWGKVVPFGFNNFGFGTSTAAPWRAGADENTIISFSHNVKVEGRDLPAGRYGLHMALEENGSVIVIFSKDISSWGSYFYDEKQDALRVTVTSEATSHHTPLLTYSFPQVTTGMAIVALDWEKKRIPFKVEVNTPEITYTHLQEELKSSKGFNNQAWIQSANYLLQNNLHLEQALAWSENAINGSFVGQKNFANYQTKANILKAMGKSAEAEALMKTALSLPSSTPNDYYNYGRALIGQDKDQEALDIFKQLNKKWKDNWLAPHGLARGYSALGDIKKALKYEKIALTKAPANAKNALEGYIKTLGEGKDFN